ncbi:MAG: hypothetical protein GWM98_23940, partial [Nitrospinaceae bacterium]|nr:hypothetical protein [Nitrospinaceae bacterium]
MGLFTKKRTDAKAESRAKKSAEDAIVKRLPLKSGTSVDRYLVEGVIGGGGFSIVYRCFDTR